MGSTPIEYIKSPDGKRQGESLNPITGCLNDCDYCYARKLAHTRLFHTYTKGNYILMGLDPEDEGKRDAYIGADHNPFQPKFWPDRVETILQWGRSRTATSPRRGVFVGDMGDVFGPWVPNAYIESILNAAAKDPADRFYFLTKFPYRLLEFNPFPWNCWVGVTVDKAGDIPRLRMAMERVIAPVRWVSLEPLYEDVSEAVKHVDWAVAGAQTNPYLAPNIEWVRGIRHEAEAHNVPVFFKNSLASLLHHHNEPLLQQMPAV